MWVLDYLPNWIFHLITITGFAGIVVSYVLKNIPFIGTYLAPIRIGALVALIVGLWFEGGISNEAKWQSRVDELKAKMELIEKQSAEATAAIDAKVASKQQALVERQQNNMTFIELEVTKYDKDCRIPKEFIEVHNIAAEQLK